MALVLVQFGFENTADWIAEEGLRQTSSQVASSQGGIRRR